MTSLDDYEAVLGPTFASPNGTTNLLFGPSAPAETGRVVALNDPDSTDESDASEAEGDGVNPKVNGASVDDREKKDEDKPGMASEAGREKEDEDKKKQPEISIKDSIRKYSLDAWEKQLVDGIVDKRDITVTIADVQVPEFVIRSLESLTTLAIRYPEAFQYGVLRKNRVSGALLYGPSGTGKTMLARALSKQADVNMLEVSGADMQQKYVGDGEKLVRAMFKLARKLHPCIVFIDEADSVLSARKNDDTTWQRTLINQFLCEWDSLTAGDGKAAFILLASNRPFDLDTAVLRRVPQRFLIDLPTTQDRIAILKRLLDQEKLSSSVDIEALANQTASFSGSDLKNLCVTAALASLSRKVLRAKKTGKNHLSKRVLRRKHFDYAMTIVKPTYRSPAQLAELRRFDRAEARKAEGVS